MTKLIRLEIIPQPERETERKARFGLSQKEAMLIAKYRIIAAKGTHRRPQDSPSVYGVVLTLEAAEALRDKRVRNAMGGGKGFRDFENISAHMDGCAVGHKDG